MPNNSHYKHVLIAVDTTDEADEVMAAAQAVIPDGCRSSAVTVVKPLARVYGGLDMSTMADTSITFEQEALKQSAASLTKLAGGYGVAAEDCHVRLGTPAHEIRSIAEELGADLIVLGTHGRHGLGLVLGSTANSVLHGVKCDVLSVKIHPVDD
ncbi:MAG: universal stress protein [Pseudomonadaceae bacterium]|nr:universal stress protein [Pseudomonadaceae bacterium]